MKKYNQGVSVWHALIQRLNFVFDEFEQIVVSFSGGKDSGVLLNAALQVASERGDLHRMAVYHVDYEAQYQATTDYVTRTFAALPAQVRRYWICLPVKAQCATSMFQSYWQPWARDAKEQWVRPMPDGVISEANFALGFDYQVSDYEFNIRFAKAISRTERTCFLIGIRTQESLHRYKAVTKATDANEYRGTHWTSRVAGDCFNAYPIYDWLTEDIWTANARFGWDYNQLYDLFYQAGVPLHSMRVASPFNDCATESLQLYKVIDPDNWGRMIGRVNGVGFTGMYGGTVAMGWHSISKPEHFTWKQYMEFLLSTLPQHTRDQYLRKLKVSQEYWLNKGGALPDEVVEQLPADLGFENLGRPQNNRNYTRGHQVIRFREYLDETDLSNPNLLTTYKRMCIAIMKNDTACKTLGFGQTKAELERRRELMDKYKNLL